MFGQDFDVKVWSKDFEFWNLMKIYVRTCFFGKQNSTLGSVVPLAMFGDSSAVVFLLFAQEQFTKCSRSRLEQFCFVDVSHSVLKL